MKMRQSLSSTPAYRPGVDGWVRYRSVGYMTGRGLAFGVGSSILPRAANAPGKFAINMELLPTPNATMCDGRTDILADESFDYVVVGPALDMCPNPSAMFRDLVSKLRQGGHVVVFLRKETPGSSALFQFDENSVRTLFEAYGAWRMKTTMTRGNEMLCIAKKVAGRRGEITPERPRAAKRACIVRYGAIGDMVMITPLIRRLAEDGYEVTMNITPYSAPVIANNPYVSNIIFQEKDAIPNPDLHNYWAEWAGEYDRYINLSESIEGRLLKVEGRPEFFTTKAWRETTTRKNYYDYTMDLGGYPTDTGLRGEIYFSPVERREAEAFRKDHPGKFIVLWAMNGSSFHKVYPLMEPVLQEWLASHPDAVVALLGDANAAVLQFDHPQVVKTAGQWSLRRSLAAIAFAADLVVGPESMATNTAGCYDVPKITFLSHSSHENLCKHWTNDYCLAPDVTVAPCYPCHQLHYSRESCPSGIIEDDVTKERLAEGPICAMGAISGQRVIARLDEVYANHAGRS